MSESSRVKKENKKAVKPTRYVSSQYSTNSVKSAKLAKSVNSDNSNNSASASASAFVAAPAISPPRSSSSSSSSTSSSFTRVKEKQPEDIQGSYLDLSNLGKANYTKQNSINNTNEVFDFFTNITNNQKDLNSKYTQLFNIIKKYGKDIKYLFQKNEQHNSLLMDTNEYARKVKGHLYSGTVYKKADQIEPQLCEDKNTIDIATKLIIHILKDVEKCHGKWEECYKEIKELKKILLTIVNKNDYSTLERKLTFKNEELKREITSNINQLKEQQELKKKGQDNTSNHRKEIKTIYYKLLYLYLQFYIYKQNYKQKKFIFYFWLHMMQKKKKGTNRIITHLSKKYISLLSYTIEKLKTNCYETILVEKILNLINDQTTNVSIINREGTVKTNMLWQQNIGSKKTMKNKLSYSQLQNMYNNNNNKNNNNNSNNNNNKEQNYSVHNFNRYNSDSRSKSRSNSNSNRSAIRKSVKEEEEAEEAEEAGEAEESFIHFDNSDNTFKNDESAIEYEYNDLSNIKNEQDIKKRKQKEKRNEQETRNKRELETDIANTDTAYTDIANTETAYSSSNTFRDSDTQIKKYMDSYINKINTKADKKNVDLLYASMKKLNSKFNEIRDSLEIQKKINVELMKLVPKNKNSSVYKKNSLHNDTFFKGENKNESIINEEKKQSMLERNIMKTLGRESKIAVLDNNAKYSIHNVANRALSEFMLNHQSSTKGSTRKRSTRKGSIFDNSHVKSLLKRKDEENAQNEKQWLQNKMNKQYKDSLLCEQTDEKNREYEQRYETDILQEKNKDEKAKENEKKKRIIMSNKFYQNLEQIKDDQKFTKQYYTSDSFENRNSPNYYKHRESKNADNFYTNQDKSEQRNISRQKENRKIDKNNRTTREDEKDQIYLVQQNDKSTQKYRCQETIDESTENSTLSNINLILRTGGGFKKLNEQDKNQYIQKVSYLHQHNLLGYETNLNIKIKTPDFLQNIPNPAQKGFQKEKRYRSLSSFHNIY